MSKRAALAVAGVVAVAVAAGMIMWWPGSAEPATGRRGGDRMANVALPADLPDRPPQLDLSTANRREPVAGLPDWSHAGYREGAGLPGQDKVTGNVECVVPARELAERYDVRPDDGTDDTHGLQQAVDDIKANCSPDAGYDELSLIELPAGQLDVSRQISLDADYLIVRGSGDDPETGTRLVFRPD